MKATALPVLVCTLLLGCPSGPADFRLLAEKAYPDDGSQDRKALDKLWTAMFKLPTWHLAATQASLAEKKPLVEVFAGERCVLVYTDLQMANGYAFSRSVPPAPDAGELPADGGAPQFNFAVAPINPDGGRIPASPFFGTDGALQVLSLSPAATQALLATIPDVTCIRFNEGTRRGWFAPVKAVESIHEMLKANGKL